MRLNHLIALPLALAVTGACSEEPAAPADPVAELATEIRNNTAAYASADAAAADGFVVVSPCVATEAGGMGFHYLLESRLDEVVVDTAPELLLYAPTAAGGLELVGVEYMVLAPAWDAVNATPPTLLGNTFADHRAEEDWHGLPFPHYDLHFWTGRDNPSGIWEPYNPAVSCPTV